MTSAVGKADVSAPVLVYERPRFTEPMFLKARDSPLKPKKDQDIPSEPSSSPARGLPPTGSPRKPVAESEAGKVGDGRKEGIVRRLSARARSFSSFRRDSTRSEGASALPRSQSFSARMSRRLSGLFRHNSFSTSSSSSGTDKGSGAKDELIVYVEEGRV